jgi:hypothetical protein
LILELDDTELETLPLDGMEVARIRVHGPPPFTEARLGERDYRYERSFPVRGHGANLPNFLREQMDAGRTPLVLERENRFLIYLDVAAEAADASEGGEAEEAAEAAE